MQSVCFSIRLFQSTHPRGVRRSAPANPYAAGRFQSTHPRGVRRCYAGPDRLDPAYFNPRTRVGCDCILQQPDRAAQMISIHAPAWGATQTSKKLQGLNLFQSTHPRGVRPKREMQRYFLCNFNPRTRVGCDVQLSAPYRRYDISIHAPAWGATQYCYF